MLYINQYLLQHSGNDPRQTFLISVSAVAGEYLKLTREKYTAHLQTVCRKIRACVGRWVAAEAPAGL